MKIGILLRELDVSGGTQRQALCLARELIRGGEDVTVYGLQVDSSRCYPELMREIHTVDLGKRIPSAPAAAGVAKVVRRFREMSPDFLLNREIAARLPDSLDLLNVHEHFVYPAAVYWKRRTNRPIVWMMNDVPAEFNYRRDPDRPWRRIDRFLNGKEWEDRRRRAMAARFDSVLALSRMEAERFRRVTGVEAEVVVSGLDVESFPFLRKEPPRSRPLRLFSNAILYPHRRLEDIVDSLRILAERGVPFMWVHAGGTERAPDYFEMIRRRVSEAGISGQTAFLGSVGEAELVRRFQEADVFLFPNSPQSWGLAVFQAMACGTPAVVSRGAGASEVLTHRKDAILVEPFSPEQIADALEELRGDGGLWESLHLEGRRFVETHIRWDLYAKRLMDAFSRAVRPQ